MKFVLLQRCLTFTFICSLIGIGFFSSSGTMILEKSNVLIFSCDTLHVGGSGPGNYTKIQDAINDANPGDIVFVYNGTYCEIIDIDKSLNLIGEKRYNTVINAEEKGTAVVISADSVLINNFTICNTGIGLKYFDNADIRIHSNKNIIQNINCIDTNYGMLFQNSDENIIINNYINAYWDGISLDDSENNFLRNNSMYGSGLLAYEKHDIDTSNTVNDKPIYYYYMKRGLTVPEDAGQVILINCSNFIVENLKITGTTLGISIFNSDCNIIRNNIVENNTDFGIILNNSNYNLIIENNVSNNPFGIALSAGGLELYEINSNCKYNTISKNNIMNNIGFGLGIVRSNFNTISENNFINNTAHTQIVRSKHNRFDSNFWDDWIGIKIPFIKKCPRYIPIFFMLKMGGSFKFIYVPTGFTLDLHPTRQPVPMI